MLLAAMSFSLSLWAGKTTASCKIAGSQEGATVVASIIEVGDGYVMVELDNDGTFAVNVTVTIDRSYTRSCKVSPSASNTVKVSVPNAKSTHKVSDYNVQVDGTRCK